MCPASVACAKKQIPFEWFTRDTANSRRTFAVAYEIKWQQTKMVALLDKSYCRRKFEWRNVGTIKCNYDLISDYEINGPLFSASF